MGKLSYNCRYIAWFVGAFVVLFPFILLMAVIVAALTFASTCYYINEFVIFLIDSDEIDYKLDDDNP